MAASTWLPMFDQDTLSSPACASICNIPSRPSPPTMTAARCLSSNCDLVESSCSAPTPSPTSRRTAMPKPRARSPSGSPGQRQCPRTLLPRPPPTTPGRSRLLQPGHHAPETDIPALSLAARLSYTFSTTVPAATQLGTARRHGSKPTCI